MSALKPNLSVYLVACVMLAYLGACLTQYIGVFAPTIKEYPGVGAILGLVFGFALVRSPEFAKRCAAACNWPVRMFQSAMNVLTNAIHVIISGIAIGVTVVIRNLRL